MPRLRRGEFAPFIPDAKPKELRQADALERAGFHILAGNARRSFNKRVQRNDPTTGVEPCWSGSK